MSSRWADISDGDASDTESSLWEGSTESRADVCDMKAHMALNACAPEFLPTLSMECQVVGVGYCDKICEESSLNSHFDGEESASVQMFYVPDQYSASLHKAKKRFWKRMRPQQLDIEAASSSSECLPAEASRDINIHRRLRNIVAGKETKEYQWHLEQVRLHGPGVEPLTPDPRDSSISKRSWDYIVRQWRSELRKRYEMYEANGPEGTSVASTEADSNKGEIDDSVEADSHKGETDDSATASDDGSSGSL
jgi:hypothetical protein